MSRPLVNALQRFYNNGLPLAGGKLYSYAAGTLTPQVTYTDQGALTPNANPTILDSNGHASIWISNAGYKLQLQDSLGNVIWTVDNVYLVEPFSIGATQLAPGSVGATQLASNPIGTTQIAIGAITSALIAAGAVTTGKFAAGSVQLVHLDPNIDLTQLNNMAGVVASRTDDLSGGRMFAIPQYPWSSPTKLSNPGALPAAAANDTKWSPDGRFLAVAHGTSPFVTIYERSGTTLTKLANPVTLPAGTVKRVTWSPDGDFLACAHITTPFVTVYQRQGLNFTKLTNPGTLPAIDSADAAFSPNGEFLAIQSKKGGGLGPAAGTAMYQMIGATLSYVGYFNDGVFGGNPAIAWSPDSQYFVSSYDIHGTIQLWQRAGTSFSLLSSISSSPGPLSTILSVAWSPDGQFLAFAQAASLFIYQLQGGTFTLLSGPATQPSGTPNGITWSRDAQYLAIAFNSSPFVLVYQRSGTTFTALSNPASLPAGNGAGISFSPSTQFLSIAVGTTPFINTYNTAGAFPSKSVLFSRDFLDV